MTSQGYPPPYPQQPRHAPGHAPGFPGQPPAKPRVLTWFVAYAFFMAVVYALCVVGGVFLLAAPEESVASWDGDVDAMRIQGVVLLAVGAPLMLAFAAGPLLPRRKWVWIYDLVLVAIGLTSMCCLPVTIPLLIYFIKPETKAWFDERGFVA